MDVEITRMPEQRVGSVRHTGPYNTMSEAFGRLGQIAGRGGLFSNPAASMLALYHDDPSSTPPAQLRSDAAITVTPDAKLPADLVEQRVPAGRYAKTIHVGSYETLGDTWKRLLSEWLPASGERLASGPSYERYLNNPTTTPKDQLRTEIYVPIAD